MTDVCGVQNKEDNHNDSEVVPVNRVTTYRFHLQVLYLRMIVEKLPEGADFLLDNVAVVVVRSEVYDHVLGAHGLSAGVVSEHAPRVHGLRVTGIVGGRQM